MSDLISRSALIEELQVLKTLAKGPAQERLIRRQLYAVGHAPAVDAVEVCRCKDCQYYEAKECVCPYIWMSDGAHLWTGADDFCSYGERKDGADG